MKPMELNGIKIEFQTRPRHKAVMAVKNIMNNVLMDVVDLTTLDGESNVNDVIQRALIDNPQIMLELNDISASLPMDRTIMLSTGMDYRSLKELKDEIFEDEYIALYENAKKALGGKDASDFLDIYPSNINSMGLPEME